MKPRLFFIRDLDAIENIPEIRMLYYAEVKEKEGHPDFEYSRRKLIELDIEEKRRNELLKQALDRMNHYYDNASISEKPEDVEAGRIKRVEMLLKEDEERDRIFKEAEREANTRSLIPHEGREITIIDEGDFHYDRIKVTVPEEVLANKKYRKRIEKAKTRGEVEVIILEYYKNEVKK